MPTRRALLAMETEHHVTIIANMRRITREAYEIFPLSPDAADGRWFVGIHDAFRFLYCVWVEKSGVLQRLFKMDQSGLCYNVSRLPVI